MLCTRWHKLDNVCLKHVSQRYAADASLLNYGRMIKPKLTVNLKSFIKPLLQDILSFSLNFFNYTIRNLPNSQLFVKKPRKGVHPFICPRKELRSTFTPTSENLSIEFYSHNLLTEKRCLVTLPSLNIEKKQKQEYLCNSNHWISIINIFVILTEF